VTALLECMLPEFLAPKLSLTTTTTKTTKTATREIGDGFPRASGALVAAGYRIRWRKNHEALSRGAERDDENGGGRCGFDDDGSGSGSAPIAVSFSCSSDSSTLFRCAFLHPHSLSRPYQRERSECKNFPFRSSRCPYRKARRSVYDSRMTYHQHCPKRRTTLLSNWSYDISP
jgi:hypothetical protein